MKDEKNKKGGRPLSTEELLMKRNVYVGDTLWWELSQQAREEGRSVSNLLLTLAQNYIATKKSERGH